MPGPFIRQCSSLAADRRRDAGVERAAYGSWSMRRWCRSWAKNSLFILRGATRISDNSMDVPLLRRSCPRATRELAIEPGAVQMSVAVPSCSGVVAILMLCGVGNVSGQQPATQRCRLSRHDRELRCRDDVHAAAQTGGDDESGRDRADAGAWPSGSAGRDRVSSMTRFSRRSRPRTSGPRPRGRVPLARRVAGRANPDFVYAAYASAFGQEAAGPREELVDLGAHSYVSPAGCGGRRRPESVSIATVYGELRDIGRIFGVSARAEQVIATYQADIQATQARIGIVKKPPTVFWYDSGDPPSAGACCGSPNEIMRLVGAENVFGDTPGSWTQRQLGRRHRQEP